MDTRENPEPETPETERVRLDSRRLRALAHPLRMRLLAALRLFGPATATELARRLDTNSGQTSYHLRQLAEVGLIEDDPDHSTARDRYWRARHQPPRGPRRTSATTPTTGPPTPCWSAR